MTAADAIYDPTDPGREVLAAGPAVSGGSCGLDKQLQTDHIVNVVD